MNQSAAEWLSRVPRHDGDLDAFLDELVVRRQEMISLNIVRDVLTEVASMMPHAVPNPRFNFLAAVAYYHETIVAKKGTPELWSIIAARFESIQPVTAMLSFYVLNYAFLAYRNAGGVHEKRLQPLYEKASITAEHLEEQERHEALGHLHYNWARYLLKSGRRHEALVPWQKSSEQRVAFYEDLKQQRKDRDTMLAAAQQIAKMRCDFRKDGFFPEVPTELCGVSEELYDALEVTFGEKLTAFSAAK